jgi:DNA polymerase III epsilon subunit-like protein
VWPFGRRPQGAAAAFARLAPTAARYAVIDSELTGLDSRRDAIVSLGGLRVREGFIVIA